MKKINKYILFLLIPFFISCNWEIPKSIAVKTEADYNFTIGNIDDIKLSEYISAEKLKTKMPSTGETVFSIYDYDPNGTSETKQFLIDFALKEIPLDIGKYFENMDFANGLKGLDFNETFDIPNISIDDLSNELSFPDLNEKIRNSVVISLSNLSIPHGINGSVSEAMCPSQDISISTPDFDTLSFYSGSLDIVASTDAVVPGFSTNLKIALYDSAGVEITSASGIDLNQISKTITLPLSGRILYPNMKLKISGSTTGGTSPNTSEISLNAFLSSDAKFSKVTGVTMNVDTISINQAIDMSTDNSFEKCVIADKSSSEKSIISIKASLPSNWSGVVPTNNINLSGGITASNSEFDVSNESGTELINRKLFLKDKEFKNDNINVTGSVAVALSDATIYFNNGNLDPIEIKTSCKVTKLSSITIDLSKRQESFESSYNYNENLPSGVAEYIKRIELNPSGMKVAYINTLPAGNNINLKAVSTFFKVDATEVMSSNMEDGSLNILGDDDLIKDIASDTKIDFSAELKLPGATVENPNLVVLKNIEIGKSYSLGISITPVFDWKWAEISTDGTAVTGDVDTGLNFNEIFKDFTDKLGNASFINRINITSIPLYLYSVIPDVDAGGTGESLARRLSFKGTLVAKSYDENDVEVGSPVYILGTVGTGDSEISSVSSLPSLSFDSSNKTVINEVSGSNKADISVLFNNHTSGNIKMEYNLKLSEKNSSNTIKIIKDDINNLSETETLSIKMHARILLPFELEIKEDPSDFTNPLSIDIMKLMDKQEDEDIFGRSEPTNIEDIEKYINVIDYAKIEYKVNNKLLKYTTSGVSGNILLDTKISGIAPYSINFGSGDIAFSSENIVKILKQEPFHPVIEMVMPVGKFYIPKEAEIGVSLAVVLKTDGTVELFGGK